MTDGAVELSCCCLVAVVVVVVKVMVVIVVVGIEDRKSAERQRE